ncbi:hypothetical protein RJ640_011452 [Escallonia rubra]|uniref:chlorophyllase n=1 Tax=Escallonia rubra TaxID=112253 RepID=A0AA88R0L8_9ASTE|nr:hypothetical protein RJ640_011452 [Escallonia rubra]
MSTSSSVAAPADTKVFSTGKYTAVTAKIELERCTTKPSLSNPPPKPLLLVSPSEAGEYPVLVFLHGYLFYNTFYSQLLKHVASHGFIVVAPQLYSVAGPDATAEIQSTAAVTNWLPDGLDDSLPPDVHPNLSRLALSGHSRGGKAAFALVLNKVPKSATSLKFSALIGVDPVDGMDKGKQTPPPVLSYIPRSFDLHMPVLVIGSGLGDVKKNPLFPACAPKGVNHKEFFSECREPACHLVARDFGHVDMLDDDTKGIRGKASYCLCKNGKSREPMRRFVGGITVAFLRAYLEGNSSDLMAIRDRHELAPLELQEVEFLL